MRTIIEMAREAGISDCTCSGTKGCLGRFAAFVRADEREACAKVCDARYMGDNNREDAEAKRCAAAIRARGNTCTPPVAAGSQAFYGFPDGPVSTLNASGKCVTAGETAPIDATQKAELQLDQLSEPDGAVTG